LWLLAEYIGATQPKHIEFYSPVRFAVLVVGSFFLYPLLLIFLPWPATIWLLIAILTVGWSLRQLEKVKMWYATRKVERMVAAERARLVKMRKGLLVSASAEAVFEPDLADE
jgi:hypothetical protein